MQTDRFILHLLPARTDNYIYVLHDIQGKATIVVDPSEAAPVLEFLERQKWQLNFVLNTHHHHDHVGGNVALEDKTGACIVGFEGDKERLPGVELLVEEGEEIYLGSLDTMVLFIPGHTLGHIAYHLPEQKLLFCGDTLFSLGCGRLFEGTSEQMAASLQKIMALPEDTLICCGHEYTLANGEFALTVDSDNQNLRARIARAKQLRAEGKPTLPVTLGEELKTNPFLRVLSGDLKLPGAGESPEEQFKLLREMKDRF